MITEYLSAIGAEEAHPMILEFLSIWEEMYNPVFNLLEFEGINSEAGLNRFAISVKQWISKTIISWFPRAPWEPRWPALRAVTGLSAPQLHSHAARGNEECSLVLDTKQPNNSVSQPKAKI